MANGVTITTYIAWLALLALPSACGRHGDTESTVAALGEFNALTGMSLGVGSFSLLENPRSTCIEFSTETSDSEGTTSALRVEVIDNHDALVKVVGLSPAAQLKANQPQLGNVSAKAAFVYDQDIRTSSGSLYFLVRSTVMTKTVKATGIHLLPEYATLLSKLDPSRTVALNDAPVEGDDDELAASQPVAAPLPGMAKQLNMGLLGEAATETLSSSDISLIENETNVAVGALALRLSQASLIGSSGARVSDAHAHAVRKFLSNCGDEFMLSKTKGGEFYALVELHYKDSEEAKSYKGDLGALVKRSDQLAAAGSLDGDAQVSFSRALKNLARNATMNIATYQIGGVGIDAIQPTTIDAMLTRAVSLPVIVSKTGAAKEDAIRAGIELVTRLTAEGLDPGKLPSTDGTAARRTQQSAPPAETRPPPVAAAAPPSSPVAAARDPVLPARDTQTDSSVDVLANFQDYKILNIEIDPAIAESIHAAKLRLAILSDALQNLLREKHFYDDVLASPSQYAGLNSPVSGSTRTGIDVVAMYARQIPMKLQLLHSLVRACEADWRICTIDPLIFPPKTRYRPRRLGDEHARESIERLSYSGNFGGFFSQSNSMWCYRSERHDLGFWVRQVKASYTGDGRIAITFFSPEAPFSFFWKEAPAVTILANTVDRSAMAGLLTGKIDKLQMAAFMTRYVAPLTKVRAGYPVLWAEFDRCD